MPTYEYRCNDCEEQFETFQKMTDEPLKTCQVCGGELVKLISGGMGIIFKGSGFYTTDYKNASSGASSSKGSSESGSSDSSKKETETKSESKSSDSSKKNSTKTA